MVRSENNNMRSFISVVVNMSLLIAVAAGTFYAVAPVIA